MKDLIDIQFQWNEIEAYLHRFFPKKFQVLEKLCMMHAEVFPALKELQKK